MNQAVNHPPIFFESIDFGTLETYLKQNFSEKKKVILVDENTNKMCLPILQNQVAALQDVLVLEVPSGERHKTMDTCISIWQTLSDHNIQRNDLLINVGGGMVSDIGGFVAASFKRGMSYINIPTSLLAQVDASIGGKTGVNLQQYKNMVGSIYLPQAIFIYYNFLKTLPKRQVSSGFAEIIKTALIADKTLWKTIHKMDQLRVDRLAPLIKTTSRIKQSIVETDLQEMGMRKALNFGHTVGHALETYSMANHKEPCFHGEAVAMGVICETFISYRMGWIDKAALDEVVHFITLHFGKLPFDLADVSMLLTTMKKDKKRTNQAYNFTLLQPIGSAKVNVEVEEKQIVDSLHYLYHTQF